jgi:hypothetical protein
VQIPLIEGFTADSKAERGLRVIGRDKGLPPSYAGGIAVVVGINEYMRWPPLECAVADALLVKRFLEQRGFDVFLLVDRDATKHSILDTVRGMKGRNLDKVLFFFAGHGHTRTDGTREEGFIVPVDGERSERNRYSISLQSLKREMKEINARHVLLVFDSCYSGLALQRSGGIDATLPGYLAEVDSMESIQVLTAGRRGDKAVERFGHGIFTQYFIKAARGEADSNSDGVLTASEINQWVRPMVYEESERSQLPMYGHLLGEGEFLFILEEKEANLVRRESLENWMNRANRIFDEIERSANPRTLRLTTKDPLFERVLELVERNTTMDVKSFILTTINYGVEPNSLRFKSILPYDRRASKRENDEGVVLYREYRKNLNKTLLRQAIKRYVQAIAFDPGNSEAFSNLSLAYYREGKHRYAVWAGLKAIETTDQRGTIAASLYNIGLCFREEKMDEKTLVFFLAALSLRKKGTGVYDIVKSRITKIFESQH